MLQFDILYKIYKEYLFNKCIKNMDIYKLCINKDIYNLLKNYKCKLIILENIKLCTIHENNDIIYIENLKIQLNNYFYKLNKNINETFIHCKDMDKNKQLTKIITKHYDLEIGYYCCEGNGIKINNKLDNKLDNINMIKLNKLITNFY